MVIIIQAINTNLIILFIRKIYPEGPSTTGITRLVTQKAIFNLTQQQQANELKRSSHSQADVLSVEVPTTEWLTVCRRF